MAGQPLARPLDADPGGVAAPDTVEQIGQAVRCTDVAYTAQVQESRLPHSTRSTPVRQLDLGMRPSRRPGPLSFVTPGPRKVDIASTLLPAEATAQVSYWVLPAARGTGAAARAARAVTRWGFETLGLHRIYLTHSVANVPSCRVAAQAGFPLEGTLRDYMLHADGWHDVHMHARLAAD